MDNMATTTPKIHALPAAAVKPPFANPNAQGEMNSHMARIKLAQSCH
jgi:hypothetical protein